MVVNFRSRTVHIVSRSPTLVQCSSSFRFFSLLKAAKHSSVELCIILRTSEVTDSIALRKTTVFHKLQVFIRKSSMSTGSG